MLLGADRHRPLVRLVRADQEIRQLLLARPDDAGEAEDLALVDVEGEAAELPRGEALDPQPYRLLGRDRLAHRGGGRGIGLERVARAEHHRDQAIVVDLADLAGTDELALAQDREPVRDTEDLT